LKSYFIYICFENQEILSERAKDKLFFGAASYIAMSKKVYKNEIAKLTSGLCGYFLLNHKTQSLAKFSFLFL